MDDQQYELPAPWPFDQPPNCGVFTTGHVIHAGEAVRHVFHDAEDLGWQFHYAGSKTQDDAMLVALSEICRHDPTVLEVADLPPGWMAIRERLGSDWIRSEKA